MQVFLSKFPLRGGKEGGRGPVLYQGVHVRIPRGISRLLAIRQTSAYDAAFTTLLHCSLTGSPRSLSRRLSTRARRRAAARVSNCSNKHRSCRTVQPDRYGATTMLDIS